VDFYTQLDLLVLALPLALSFDRKVAFWRHWPRVALAILAVMAVYIPWDVWKTTQGVWGFNPQYAGEGRWWHLPRGEWLFFICVPYACLFILACVRAYFRDADPGAAARRRPGRRWFLRRAGRHLRGS
jgi:lycopene cyclase domain-containing protein